MQKNKLLILLSGLCASSYSQTITVRDQSSREPLENVVIQDRNNVQVKTNIKGKADLSTLLKGDSVFVYQFGYATKNIINGCDRIVNRFIC
jgi:hypothetical protein